MEKASEDIVLAIIVSSIILVILAVFTTLFFLVFVRKKRIMEKNKEQLRRNFEKQLLETKLEIQTQTLNNVSQDLHDNIGQVLSFVKLSLSMATALDIEDKDSKIRESVQLIAGAIVDLRDLSKSLSFERLKQEGLAEVIRYESERMNRSGMIRSCYKLHGEPFFMPAQTTLIIYRMFQEIVNNTIKHAFSKDLFIDLSYHQERLDLKICDSGVGFNKNSLKKWQGQGLENINQRASMINASVTIITSPGEGCCTNITLHIQPEQIT